LEIKFQQSLRPKHLEQLPSDLPQHQGRDSACQVNRRRPQSYQWYKWATCELQWKEMVLCVLGEKNSVISMVRSLKNQISIFKNQTIFKSQLTNLLKPG